MEIKLKQVAKLKGKGFTETTGRVYDPNGLAPTIQTLQGGNREPKIIAMRGRDAAVLVPKRTEYGKSVRKDYENGAIKEQRKNMQMLEPRGDGLTNTLTTVQKDNLVCLNPKIIYEKPLIRKGWHRKACEVLNVNGITTCLHTQSNNLLQKVKTQSVIRKLTPRECFRLMAFTDADFDKAKYYSKEECEKLLRQFPKHKGKRQFTHEQRIERMSNSQIYKQAGNSIVVTVPEAIFRKMIGGEIHK